MQERIEGPDKEIAFTREGKRAILNKLGRGRRLREVPATPSSPAPSASASTARESLIPALEQIIKRGGNLGVTDIVLRHGPSRPPQRADPGDGRSRTARCSTSSRAAPPRPTKSRARAT